MWRANRAGRQSRRRPRRRIWWSWLRLALLLALAIGIIARFDPFDLGISTEARGQEERVSARFVPCRGARAAACVVDGDSFRLGSRRVRIRDIDAPEIGEARCDSEREKGRAAAARLLDELNRGPFLMAAKAGDAVDQYGRDLRLIYRLDADGRRRSIGDVLVEAGLAHRYVDHKIPWC